MGNKIDEALKELKNAKIELERIENEKSGLEKENIRLSAEISSLNKDRKNIKSYIEDKEKGSREKIAALLKQAEDDARKAMQDRAQAGSVLDENKKKQGELDKLISQTNSKMNEYSALIDQNNKLKAKLEAIAGDIVSKLKG